MAERKVLNKYYPPDFDPRALTKAGGRGGKNKKKGRKNGQSEVMMMMPMSVRCSTCGQYIFKGKKFNSRKETVVGEDYLGIKVFRFYMKCDSCRAEFTIRTDPKNADWVVEFGAHRTVEKHREEAKQEEEARREREEEDRDAMKALENKTQDSRAQLDALEALEAVRELNARNSRSEAVDDLLRQREEEDRRAREEQDRQDSEELERLRLENRAVRSREEDEEARDRTERRPAVVPEATSKRPLLPVVRVVEQSVALAESSLALPPAPKRPALVDYANSSDDEA